MPPLRGVAVRDWRDEQRVASSFRSIEAESLLLFQFRGLINAICVYICRRTYPPSSTCWYTATYYFIVPMYFLFNFIIQTQKVNCGGGVDRVIASCVRNPTTRPTIKHIIISHHITLTHIVEPFYSAKYVQHRYRTKSSARTLNSPLYCVEWMDIYWVAAEWHHHRHHHPHPHRVYVAEAAAAATVHIIISSASNMNNVAEAEAICRVFLIESSDHPDYRNTGTSQTARP